MTAQKFLIASACLTSLALVSALGAAAQTASLTAELNGGDKCDSTAAPNGPICRKGDLNGFGLASVTMPSATTICVSLLVNGIANPTAAHIHAGPAGVNGVVVVSLPPPATGSLGSSAACVAAPAGFNANLRNNPGGFYVNVHNAQFPGGAIRGQLH